MARWRLTEDHYIFAKQYNEPTEWEYRETDRVTGRELRKRFKVPLYCNREFIVCWEGSEHPSDNGNFGPIIFEGQPTPGMEPIDDEARVISAEESKKWSHPIDDLPGNFSAADLLANLQRQLATAASTSAPVSVVANGVSKEEFEALKAQLAELMAQNAELMAEGKGRRKVA